MTFYEDLILEELIGVTPKEKYEKLLLINKLLDEIAMPRRGTIEEKKTLQDFAEEILKNNLIKTQNNELEKES